MSELPDIKGWIDSNPIGVIAVIGKHFAGKTTFLKHIAQLCEPVKWFR
jgi:ABC-type phosphate/phosphonate transport system ATPase subunit